MEFMTNSTSDYKYFYSPSTRGFYLKEIHGEEGIPLDAVGPIDAATHAALITGQSDEVEIWPDVEGYPKLRERVFSLEQLQNAIRHVGKVMRTEAVRQHGFFAPNDAVQYAPLGDPQALKFLAWYKDLDVAIETLIAGKTTDELLALKKDRVGTIAMLPPFGGTT